MTIRFDEVLYPNFPSDWQKDSDFVESLLVAGAIELEARRRISSASPFDDNVFVHLPARFRYDVFASLIGDHERIGRMPLLALVWQFVDEVISVEGKGEPRDSAGYVRTLARVENVVLGPHATSLFMASFGRRWYGGSESELTAVELAFCNGEAIFGSNGRGILAANGYLYMDSIWPTVFRLLERRNVQQYLMPRAHRIGLVLDILDRGAERGLAGVSRYGLWPGWPAQ
jgi:hypothetical protein